MKHFFTLLLSFGVFLSADGQRTIDKKLEKEIKSILVGFRGNVGVYIKELRKDRTIAINADTIFPTASMVKIPILVGIMDKIERRELTYEDELVYSDSLLYEGVDILGSFRNNEKIEVGKVIMLMLTMSDNTASLWLQKLAGTGERINRLLDSFGLQHTRVNSRTPGREQNRSMYGWGQTTPREMATLVEKIYRKEILSVSTSEKMMRLLGRNFWDDHALSQIPPTIQVFSKNGAVNQSRSEVLLVNHPRRPYVFCIITKNNVDERWTPDNEAWTMTRKLSALLWRHFNK